MSGLLRSATSLASRNDVDLWTRYSFMTSSSDILHDMVLCDVPGAGHKYFFSGSAGLTLGTKSGGGGDGAV